ncbi:hypothetical protein A1OS_21720 [Enterovibrio norvegicus]|uniref:glycosyltransferase family 2 protein n=1 Tax=Enterovibrio norvegicus TaxID=188144 RepID=UPI0003195574|nr:glycosyltransferase family 2 protein [Enterovibrio norvegicus]OEE57324.1 hypothetical protein A1OS_21720 [Enterovibrio norvegicus]
MNNLVSIITPTFNAIDYISETYDSIKSQKFTNWEWVVTDDLSTDGTYEYLVELSFVDERIKVFRNLGNAGAAVSRNNSIKQASGRFIAFLDADDLWQPNKLSTQIEFMMANNVALSYSDYSFVDEKSTVIDKVRKTPDYLDYRTLLRVNIIGCLTAIYDSDVIGKVYMPLIRKRQDYGLWLNVLKIVPKAYRCPGVLAVYRLRENSVSSNKFKLLRYNFELFYKHQNLSFFKSFFYMSMNVYNKLRSV